MRLYWTLSWCTTCSLAFNSNSNTLRVFKLSFRSSEHKASTRLPAVGKDSKCDGAVDFESAGRSWKRNRDTPNIDDKEQVQKDALLLPPRAADRRGASGGGSTTEDEDKIVNVVSAPLLAQSTAVLAEALVNTEAAYSVLAPVHKWRMSQRRVAAAVRDEERVAQAADYALKQTAAVGFFARLMSPGVAPQTFTTAYNAVMAAVEAAGNLASGIAQTVQDVVAIPDKAKRFADDVAETTNSILAAASSVPERAQETVQTAADLREQTERFVAAGAEACAKLRAAASTLPEKSHKLADSAALQLTKASETLEDFPSNVPVSVDTAAEDAQVIADNAVAATLAGLQAAGAALLGSLAEAGRPVVDNLVRHALLPIHTQRLSTLRVSAAVSAEQALLPPPPRSTEAETVSGRSTMSEAEIRKEGRLSMGAVAVNAAGKRIKFRFGLRQRFAAWRRKRRPLTSTTEQLVAQSSNNATQQQSKSRLIAPIEQMVSSTSPGIPTAAMFLPSANTSRKQGTTAPAVSAPRTDTRGARITTVTDSTVGKRSTEFLLLKEKREARKQDAVRPSEIAEAGDLGSSSGAFMVDSPASVDTTAVSGMNPREDTPKLRTSSGVKKPQQIVVDPRSKSGPSGSALYLDATDSDQSAKVTPGAVNIGKVPLAETARQITDEQEQAKGVATAVDERRALEQGSSISGPADAWIRMSGVSKESENEVLPATSPVAEESSQGSLQLPKAAVVESYADRLSASTIKQNRRSRVTFLPSEVDSDATRVSSSSFTAALPSSVPGTENSPPLKDVFVEEQPEINVVLASSTEIVESTVEKPAVAPEEESPASNAASKETVESIISTSSSDDRGHVQESGVWEAAGKFLNDWITSAVPAKKAQLEEKRSAVCWEQQWYPIATTKDLPQSTRDGRSAYRFEMLGQKYDLLPRRRIKDRTTSTASTTAKTRWNCRVAPDVGDNLEGPSTSLVEILLHEASGLLWAWPDASPEGLARSALTRPPELNMDLPPGAISSSPTTEISDELDNQVYKRRVPLPWRLLSRSRPRGMASPERARARTRPANDGRRNLRIDQSEHELLSGYTDTVRALLAPRLGAAVQAAAGGDVHGVAAVTAPASGMILTSANSSGFGASIDTAAVQARVSFAVPGVIEWRFSPGREKQAGIASASSNTTVVDDGASGQAVVEPEMAGTAATPPTQPGSFDKGERRPRWLRWRGLGTRATGVATIDHSNEMGERGRRREFKNLSGGAAERYVAVVLPVGPGRTKVFARLETAPVGLLEGASFWWARRIRSALLAKALDDVVIDLASRKANSLAAAAEGKSKSRKVGDRMRESDKLLPASVEDWLKQALHDPTL